MTIDLRFGDCLEVMKNIENGSIDMVLVDPPYGITSSKWDSVIPLEPMWEALKRIVKDNGAIAIMGSQPFTSELIDSPKRKPLCFSLRMNFCFSYIITYF